MAEELGCIKQIGGVLTLLKLIGGVTYAIWGTGPAWVPVAPEYHWILRLAFPEFFALVWFQQWLGPPL